MNIKTRLLGQPGFYKIKTSPKGRIVFQTSEVSVCAQRSLGTVVSPAKINSSISTGIEKRTFIIITSTKIVIIIIAIIVPFVKRFL